MHKVAWVLCFFLLAGCGKPSDGGKTVPSTQAQKAITSASPPEPRTDSGKEATASSSQKADAQAPQPIVSEPATLPQVLKIVDFRQLPKPEKTIMKIVSPTQLFYSVPGTLSDTAGSCKKQLKDMDWIEDSVKIPGLDPARYVFSGFDKAGFHVALTVSKSTKGGWIDVSFTNLGNVDPRRLPRPADARASFDYWHYVSYATASKPQEVIELCRKELIDKGWKEYAVASAKFHAKEGRFLTGFVNNAMDLSVNAKAEPAGKTVVEYRMSIRDKPSPGQTAAMPPAAKFSEGMKAIDLRRFPRLADADDARGSSAGLYYQAPGDVPKAVAFYRDKLKAEGWAEEPANTVDEIKDLATTRFDKNGFHLELEINKGDKPDRVTIHLQNQGNIDVRQFPRLADAAVGGLEGFGDVFYETQTRPDAAVAFYRKELVQRGWKEDKAETKVYPGGSTSLVFEQNAVILTLRIDRDSVRIQSQLLGEPIPRSSSKK
jgi:hypothetical protein